MVSSSNGSPRMFCVTNISLLVNFLLHFLVVIGLVCLRRCFVVVFLFFCRSVLGCLYGVVVVIADVVACVVAEEMVCSQSSGVLLSMSLCWVWKSVPCSNS